MIVSSTLGNNYNSYSTTGTPGTASSASGDDSSALESVNGQIFQNIFHSGTIDGLVTENEDGTYTFNNSAVSGPISSQTWLARSIIADQSADVSSFIQNGNTPTSSDIGLFKQMTGYNYINTIDGSTYADDNGNPPPASALPSINEALSFMSQIETARQNGSLNGSLTADFAKNLLTNIQHLAKANPHSMAGAWAPTQDFFDKLLGVLNQRSMAAVSV